MLRMLRAIFRRNRIDREMREEMDAHLARATERLVARGMSPEAARLEARREFGNVAGLQEESRDVRGTQWIESLVGDVRFAFRHFSRRPLSALTIVIVLALGIGGHSAVFSIMQAILVRPAPGVPEDDALVLIRQKERGIEETNWFSREISYPEFQDDSAMRDVFTDVAGWDTDDVALDTPEGKGVMARGHYVTDGFFRTLGAPLALGPGLAPSTNAESGPTAVIGYAMWQDVFKGSSDVLGQTIRVNGVAARVVGVAPPRFNNVTRLQGRRVVWLPLSARAAVARSTSVALTSRDTALLSTFGRLRPGVSIEQASAAIGVAGTRALAQMTPSDRRMSYAADVIPLRGAIKLRGSEESVVVDALQLGGVLGGIAVLILIIACTNVSAIAVGAAVARRHEIAVRMSLGASRMRVVRQLLTESALLAIAGGALGLLIYWWITMAIASQATDVELAPDVGTIAFTMVFALGTGILFGLSPALHATRQGVGEVLKDSGAGATKRSHLQRVFVVAQIAFTQPLLVGLAMMLGFVRPETRGVWRDDLDNRIAVVRLYTYTGTGTTKDEIAALKRLENRLAELSGVESVVRASGGFHNATFSIHPDDRGASQRATQPVDVHVEAGAAGYFKMLGVPIIRGRELTAADSGGLNVVIGSDLARELWEGADVIGKRFVETGRDGKTQDRTIVGVFDARYATPRGPGPHVYAMPGWVSDSYLVRTTGPASATFSAIREAVHLELPTIPVAPLSTIREREEANARETAQVSASAAGGGLLALLLASIGLYGVIALAVTQRRREIGIRMALGARATQVVTMLFTSGVRLSLLGLLLGLPLSVVALRLLMTQMPIPETSVSLIGGGIAVVVIGVASLATWIPARRAAAIDPVAALRAE